MSAGDNTENNTSFTSHIERWTAPRDSLEPPVVLEPEHPFMQKFQKALNQYLLKQNERVSTDIQELTANLRQKKKDYEYQMSHEIFSLEQEVNQQRNTIQKYEESLEGVVRLRMEREATAKNSRETYKEQVNQLNQAKKRDQELRSELEALSLLCRQYEAWQVDTNSELAVSQRISEKMAEEKQRLAEEKKELDVMVYKLTTQVWQLQAQMSLFDEQLGVKARELEAVKGRVAEGSADLEALDAEHRRLMQAWGSVIVNITQRDNVYTAIADEYHSVQSDFQTLVAGIESLKKQITLQMQKHEDLTITRDRTAYDLADCMKAVEMEEKRRQSLEASIAETTAALELTEKDLVATKNEHTSHVSNLKAITREFEKLTEEKLTLENETLDRLQERLTSDKAAENMAATIRKLKQKARKQEISMLNAENQQAKIMLEMERQKVHNAELATAVGAEKEAAAQREAELAALETRVAEHCSQVERKQSGILQANAKIAAIVAKMEGKEMAPVERKIEELEKTIADSSTQAKQLQQDWLRMQGNVVQLTGQYHRQLADISLSTKQIQILENKNNKLENEINAVVQEEEAVARALDALQTRLDILHRQKSTDLRHTEELQASFNHLTQEYMAQLKDAEMESMTIEEEIKELEEEKEQLAVELHKTRREALAWQKRGILAIETKQKVDKEKSATGDVGKMKLEIHKMQVRQQQLERTAGRLATDLAQGVGRREAAVTRARALPAAAPQRRSLPAKIKDKRGDIRRVHQETEVNKGLVESYNKDQAYIEQVMVEKRQAIVELENQIKLLDDDIEAAQTKKQMQLEMIVRYQRYAARCSALSEGRGLLGSRAQSAVELELERQRRTSRQLTGLARRLLELLPEHRAPLLRALTSLRGAAPEPESPCSPQPGAAGEGPESIFEPRERHSP